MNYSFGNIQVSEQQFFIANIEEEHHGKNISGLLENPKYAKERNKREGTNDSQKSRSAMERKHSERYVKVYLMIKSFLDSVRVYYDIYFYFCCFLF